MATWRGITCGTPRCDRPWVVRFGPGTTRWNELALVAPDQAPHSVLLERRSDFRIYLPPIRLEGPLP